MVIGIGGRGSHTKSNPLVRALLRSDLDDLTIVTDGGPDVARLCTSGKIREIVLDRESFETGMRHAQFRAALRSGDTRVRVYGEGLLEWGLYAAGIRLPYLPVRRSVLPDAGCTDSGLRTVADPYGDAELAALPAIALDAALMQAIRADIHGNGHAVGTNTRFDHLLCHAADRVYVSCEVIAPTGEIVGGRHRTRARIPHVLVTGVVPALGGR